MPITIYEIEGKSEKQFFDYYIEILILREIDIEKELFMINDIKIECERFMHIQRIYTGDDD